MTAEQFFQAVMGRAPANPEELQEFLAAFLLVTAQVREGGGDLPGAVPTAENFAVWQADTEFYEAFTGLMADALSGVPPQTTTGQTPQGTQAEDAELTALKEAFGVGEKKPTQSDLFFQVLRERGMMPAPDDDATFAFLQDIFVRMQRLALGQPLKTDFAEIVRANLPETAQELRQIQVQQTLFEEEFNDAFERQLAEQGIILPSSLRNKVRAALGQQFEIADTQAGGKLTAQDFLVQNLQPSINTAFQEADTEMKRRQVEELAAVDPEKAGRLAAEFFPIPQPPAPTDPPAAATGQKRLNEIKEQLRKGGLSPGQEDNLRAEQADLEGQVEAGGGPEAAKQAARVATAFADIPTLGEGTGPRTARGAAEFIAGPLEQDIEGIIKAARAGIKDQDFLSFLDLQIPQLTEEFTGRVRTQRAMVLAGQQAAKPDFISFLSERLPVLQGQREAEIAGQKEAQRAATESARESERLATVSAAEEERKRRERERRGQRTVLGGITSIQRVPR